MLEKLGEKKKLETLSEAIWSPFAETLNYKLCLWLTNILILLRFKILVLSPNPPSSKIFMYFPVVQIGLDTGYVVGPCTPHLTHCLHFLSCFYEKSFHNFALCSARNPVVSDLTKASVPLSPVQDYSI